MCQVFGARAGRHAAERAKTLTTPTLDDRQVSHLSDLASDTLKRRDGVDAQAVKRKIKQLMWKSVLVARNRGTLSKCVDELNRVLNVDIPRVCSEGQFFDSFESSNMCQVALMIAKAALAREESRGSHYREDFPRKNDLVWSRSISIRRNQGEMQLTKAKL